MTTSPTMRAPGNPVAFLGLVLLIAIPVWLASDRLGVIGALRVPASDLVLAFTPLLAAVILTARVGGLRAVGHLLRRSLDPRLAPRGRGLMLTLVIPPAIYILAWAAMRGLGASEPLTDPNVARLAMLFVLFMVLAAGEEVGWSGYLFGPLQDRLGPVGASIALAVPWWLGHLPSMAAIGASPVDMAWWALGAIGLRLIMAWLYNRTGANLFAMVLFHALLNLSRIAIFPVVGTHYVTAYQAASYVLVGLLAVGLVVATRGGLGRAHAAIAMDAGAEGG